LSHYVIVGMGAAGFSAAETIRQHRPGAKITLVTEEPYGYYSRPGLAYLLTNELPKRQLFPRSERELDQMGLRLAIARAERVEPRARQVILTGGRRLAYDALLLATGAAAIPPRFPGADLEGVVTLDNLDDVRHIMRLSRRVKSAVVIGGGITALELVEGLRARKVSVHYFLRRDRFWSSVLEPAESDLVESRLTHEGVKIHRHTEIAQVLGKKNWRGRQRVTGVETKDGRVIGCQMVAVAIGVRPRLDLLDGTSVRTDRGILVNDRLETSVPRIYAAGDAAQAFDPLTGKPQLDVLWPVAVAQGRAAGANMAGVPTDYRKGFPVNVTRLAGLIVTLIGAIGRPGEPDGDLLTISRGDSEIWRGIPGVLVVHQRHEVNQQRLIIKDNCLVGAVLIGDQTLAGPLQHLIEEQVDIGPIMPALQTPNVNWADLIQRLPRRRNVSVSSIRRPVRSLR
jgi:nitrite reductase (NADH) large subunit